MSVTQTPNGYSLNDSGRRVVVEPVQLLVGDRAGRRAGDRGVEQRDRHPR